MRTRTTPAAIFSLAVALSACGGSSGGGGGANNPPPPVVSTGTFEDAPVAGVQFSTATQSGITDAAGTFRYVQGEAVTFSLGGTVLGGPTQGAPVLTPEDLVQGLTMPTTSAEVAAYLADPSAAASGAFIRFLNTLIVLQSFDDDANPDNGITIPSGILTLLNGVQLELDTDPSDFRPASGIGSILDQASGSGLLTTAATRGAGRALDHYFASRGLSATILRLTTRERDPGPRRYY